MANGVIMPKVKCVNCNFPNNWPNDTLTQEDAFFGTHVMDCSQCGTQIKMSPVIDFPWVGIPTSIGTPLPPIPPDPTKMRKEPPKSDQPAKGNV